jgi:hypothetical protein
VSVVYACPNPRCEDGEVRDGDRGWLLCPDCRGRRALTCALLRRIADELRADAMLTRLQPDRDALQRLRSVALDTLELIEGSDV